MYMVLFSLEFLVFFILFVVLLCALRFYYNFLFEELTLINSILCIYFIALLILLKLDLDFIGVIFCIIYVGFILVLIIHMIRFFSGFGSVENVISFSNVLFLLSPFLLYVCFKFFGGLSPMFESNGVLELDLLNGYESINVGLSKPILSQVSDYMFFFDGLITLGCILTLLTATIGVIIINKYGNKK